MIDPLIEIQAMIRERQGLRPLAALERETGISRPMLHAVLNGWHEPGRDTLGLLLLWDREFEQPVMNYLLEVARWQRSQKRKENTAAA